MIKMSCHAKAPSIYFEKHWMEHTIKYKKCNEMKIKRTDTTATYRQF